MEALFETRANLAVANACSEKGGQVHPESRL